MKLVAAILFLCLFEGGFAQLIRNGQCVQPQGLTAIDFDQLVGLWFGYSKYFKPRDVTLKCNYFTYSQPQGDSLSLTSSAIELTSNTTIQVGDFPITITGPATYSLFKPDELPYHANVVATDYNNFLALYSCRDISATQLEEEIFIRTRQRGQISEENLTTAQSALEKAGGLIDQMILYPQDDCPATVEL